MPDELMSQRVANNWKARAESAERERDELREALGRVLAAHKTLSSHHCDNVEQGWDCRVQTRFDNAIVAAHERLTRSSSGETG